MEVEGRRCSRLFFGEDDDDQLCESDRGAADDIELMVGQLCESKNGCGVDPARGDLYFWNGDPIDARMYMVGMVDRGDRGIHESQASLASNDYGLNHEGQGNPASHDIFPRGYGN
uniref:Uncharacterized protein n=1 Tax=Panagrolaimus superbus TaxID=310955 RepID=A0A914YSJ7_9BILA